MPDRCDLLRDRLAELKDELQSYTATPADERDPNFRTIFRGLTQAVRKAERDLAACLQAPATVYAGYRLVAGVPISPEIIHQITSTGPCVGGRPDPSGMPMCDFVRPAANKAVIYYPATADGLDTPLAPGGPYRVLVFGHGRRVPPSCQEWEVCHGTPRETGEDYRQLSGVQATLARLGFVSIAPDLSWLANLAAVSDWSLVLSDAAAYLTAINARAGSPFRGRLNTAGVGLLGHSTAGAAAIQLATGGRLAVDALALMAPAEGEGAVAGYAPKPVLVFRGTMDTKGFGDNGHAALVYAAAGRKKHLVTIGGGNHFGYYDEVCILNDGVATISPGDQQRIATAYVTRFFRKYLQGAAGLDDYLAGVRPVAGLETLPVTVTSET